MYRFNMNSGYDGYSMSKRAIEAYANGEKPLSKWTKSEILSIIKDSAEEYGIDEEKIEALSKIKASVLKDKVLRYTSWHHTGSYCKPTDFYSVDLVGISKMSLEAIKELKNETAEPDPISKYHGTIYYLEWSGSRRHPKATERCLKDVDIEERGCFYYVSKNGIEILTKKIGSRGTYVIVD